MKKSIILLLLLSLQLFAYKSYTVTIPPMKFFLQNIGQSKISIKTIYERIDYKKKIPLSHVRKSAFSDFYFTVGLEEEKRYAKYIYEHNKDIKIIDTSKDIEKIVNDGKINPYIWMDPINVTKIAKIMLDTLVKNDPSNKEYFESNYNTFLKELDRIFLRVKDALFYSQNSVYVFNNNFQYYLQRFDVRYFKAENEILSGERFTKVFRESQDENIKYILVDNSINSTVTTSWTHANGMRLIRLDVYEYDWLSNLFVLAEKLSK